MHPLAVLKRSAQEATAYLKTVPDLREYEVFIASNGSLFARLNYTSHIPSNGVEEPKSIDSYGIGVQVVLETPEGVQVGFGSEPSDISLEGVRKALAKARRGAVRDPDFVSLPKPSAERRTLRRYHDPLLMRVKDGDLVGVGWLTLDGALEAFQSSEDLLALAGSPKGLNALGLIFGGDVTMLRERIAICSSNFPTVQTDESTILMAFVTAMVEAKDAKGSGYWAGSHLAEFSSRPGREAALNAIRSAEGVRVPTGQHRVVLGRQAVMDLIVNIILPSLQLDVVYAGASTFLGKLKRRVASEVLNLYDHGAMPGMAGSKSLTCEGLATGRVDLIRRGELVGFLSNYYRTQQMLRDPKAKEKLGVDPAEHAGALAPRNGFRFARGGGRHFDTTPGIFGTNVIVEGEPKASHEALLRSVGDGLYIGRIWYTYPINGLAVGDFTSTVVGDSFLIKDGKLGKPIKPNTIRLNDNVHNVLNHILAIGDEARGTLVWASDSIVYTPEVAVSNLHVDEIAGYMESVYPVR